jgi:chaperonin GroEL
MATKKNDKDFLLERIASLTGGIGVIYVGGNTDLEQKELYDRVDDAVCAVRSALEEGILPGAGMSLAYMIDNTIPDGSSKEYQTAQRILNLALVSPMTQILDNAGLCVNNLYHGREEFGEGVNVKTGEKGDLIKMGVIDPLKVTRSALQNAISVAVTILSTNAVITMARVYESNDGQQG